RLGDRRSLVLAIDDMQWGDSDSAAVVSELLRPPDPPRLLFLGSFRTEDAATSPLVKILLEAHADSGPVLERRTLEIGPLELAEAESLALALLGRADEGARAEAAAVARESRGSPFFVAELVRHVHSESGLPGCGPTFGSLDLDEVLWS